MYDWQVLVLTSFTDFFLYFILIDEFVPILFNLAYNFKPINFHKGFFSVNSVVLALYVQLNDPLKSKKYIATAMMFTPT